MKKWAAMWLTLCLALCAAGALCAEIAKVPKERMTAGLEMLPGLVEGKNVHVKRENGELEIDIQVNQVDWQQVLTYGYNAESGYVFAFPGIKNPGTVNGKAVTKQLGFGTNAGTPDSEVLDFLEMDEQAAGGSYNDAGEGFFNGWEFGQYSEAENLFAPQALEDGGLVCRWYDEDGNELLTERMKVTIKLTGKRTLNVGLEGVDRSRISAHPEDSIEDKLEISIGNGAVRVLAEDAVSQNIEKVRFHIAPPTGLKASDLGCRYRQNPSDEMKEDEDFARRGYLRLDLRMPGLRSYTIEWYDKESGRTERIERVTFTMVDKAEHPWPGYSYAGYPALTPVLGENLIVNDTTREALGKQLGIDVTYGVKGDGILHFAPSDELLEKSIAISECFFRYGVKAPANAVYYSENHMSAGDIFGYDEQFMEDQDVYLRQPKRRKPVPADRVVKCRSGYAPVREHKGDGDTRVFMPTEMTGEFAGGVTTLYWYDENGNFLSAEYFVERQDPFVITYRERELHQLPSGRIELPRLHIEGLRNDHPYMLCIDCYPQEGENSYYYELYLMDGEKNERLTLDEFRARENIRDEWLDLYLPYQGEYAMGSGVNYIVRHYNEKGGCDEYTDESSGNFILEETAQGLKLRVKSLSPFEVSHDGEGSEELTGRFGTHEVSFFFDEENPALLVQACMNRPCDACAEMYAPGQSHFAFAEVLYAPQMAPGETPKIDVTDKWLGNAPKLLFRQAAKPAHPDSYTKELPQTPGEYAIGMEVDLGGETVIVENGLIFAIGTVGAADMPVTGDASMLGAWAALLAASAAGMGLIILRRRAHN